MQRSRSLHVFLHALAGSCRLEIVAGNGDARDGLLRRKVSTKRHWHELAWQNPDHAHLPQQIARFPDRALNRDLYYWLAAYLAFESEIPADSRYIPGLEHLLRGVAVSELLVDQYPGLRRRYTRLCRACLEERDAHIGSPEHHRGTGLALLEAGIRNGLGDPKPVNHPWLETALGAARRGELLRDPPAVLTRGSLPFWPAVVWGHPSPPAGQDIKPLPDYVDSELLDETPTAGYSTDEPAEDQTHDPDARDTVADGERLTGALLYPEWHYRRHEYRPDWCRVFEQVPPAVATNTPDQELQQLAARVRRRFEAFRLQEHWQRRLTDGEEVDIDAFVDAAIERRATGHRSDQLYRHRIRNERELSVAVLLDVSNSTQGRVDGLHRVIDIAQRAMLVVAEALQGLRDEFALYAFSSYSRAFVDCLRIKGFTEAYNDTVHQRILALGPEGSTRMGAALRHVGGILAGRPSRHRLLLVLTDGRPYDPADGYEGRYALEDTRRALIDLRTLGGFPFGLTIDQKGQEYLPHLFGVGRYIVISNVAALPEALPRVYARITGLEK
jgi:nitric oxide reductase NorD protein